MNEDSERTRRTELTLSETRLYDLSSIAKPVGKFEESSSLVVVDVGTGHKDVDGSGRGIPSEAPRCGHPASHRGLRSVVTLWQTILPSPIRD